MQVGPLPVPGDNWIFPFEELAYPLTPNYLTAQDPKLTTAELDMAFNMPLPYLVQIAFSLIGREMSPSSNFSIYSAYFDGMIPCKYYCTAHFANVYMLTITNTFC